jgi:hypothetical protein
VRPSLRRKRASLVRITSTTPTRSTNWTLLPPIPPTSPPRAMPSTRLIFIFFFMKLYYYF